MIKDVLGIAISFLYFFFVVLFPRVVPKMEGEVSRKFVHIMIGNWWLILLIFFSNALSALIVPVTFCFINFFSIKKNSKNGLLSVYERNTDSTKSYGIIVYPISLVILVIVSFVLTNYHYLGGIGVIALSYGDGFAAVIGKKLPWGHYRIGHNHKTLTGSASMFIITASLMVLYLSAILHYPFDKMITLVIPTSIVASIIEAITPNGFDNLTVPISAVIIYSLLAK